jgi:hypothetical protein
MDRAYRARVVNEHVSSALYLPISSHGVDHRVILHGHRTLLIII